MRWGTLVTAITCSFVGLSQADPAAAAMKRLTRIPAEPLGVALETLAKDRDLQVIYQSEVVGNRQTAGLTGEFTPEEALSRLLQGTGLSYRYLNESTVTIVPLSSSEGSGAKRSEASGAPGSNNESGRDAKEGRTFWDRFRMAQVDQGRVETAGSVDPTKDEPARQSEKSPKGLEEVLVTAQKRQERVQDVPIPVTALSADSLLSGNNVRLQDYFSTVPGLDFSRGNRGETFIAIRGITSGGYANPTVGVVIDELPYGSSIANVGWGSAPDVDPNDLSHIEVLRGPQGTLYGASSMGGLIKYVTIDPSPDRWSGSVQAGISSVYNGAEPGYNFHAAVNVPLGETAAIRVSGFGRQDPGYIDDPTLGLAGVNRANVEGGRVAVLWRPSDTFSVKLSALLQQSKLGGSPDVTPGLPDLQQTELAGTGWRNERTGTYNLTVKGKFGSADFTSITGFSMNRISNSGDVSRFFTSLTQAQFGVPGTSILERANTDKLTQEVRLALPVGSRLDWLVGGFYTHEKSATIQDIMPTASTGIPVGEWLHFDGPIKYSEYAAFTDLTVHITDRVSVQVGARESHDTQTVDNVDTGPLVGGQVVTPTANSSENAFTYLLTPQFKVSADLMVYARLASGYRPGGPNNAAVSGNGLPPAFKPDRTQNYEIGVKGAVPNYALSFDASVFYIDWKDMQLALTDPSNGLGYYANGGRAKSKGLELSAESRPVSGLLVTGSLAWTDATLAEAFPSMSNVSGASGDRLPYSPRISGNVSIEQSILLRADLTGFVGGTMSYVGDRESEFTADPTLRLKLPGYGRLDLRLGARGDDWTATAYVTNATDKRGVLAASLGVYPPFAYNLIQPRTVGLNVSKSF